MKRFMALLVVGFLASRGTAADWYARGEFNGWPPGGNTSNQLTDLGGGHYSTTVTGLFDNTNFEYKIASLDWSTSAPGNNGKVTSNAAGEITFHLYDQTTWTDGWSPNNQRRVGYNDPLQYGWEVMGSFNGWTDPLVLANMGNGLYSGQFALNAGIYDYKFRKAGDWAINYAKDFSNSPQNNATFSVADNGDVWQFDLDLPNGRMRAFSTSQHGDFNGDGNTDAADYVTWRDTMPGNAAKYAEWRANFGRTATWIAHGSFGNDVTMTDLGNGNYATTLTGLTAGTNYDVQILRSDAGAEFPGSAAKITANASGEIKLNFFKLQSASWADGWNPSNVSRVGYDDPQQYGWEIVGAFNSWPGANDPNYQLTDLGNGLYKGTFTFPTAGTYEYKFRHLNATNPWAVSIGDNFGNSAGNNSFTVADGGSYSFELDLKNGRWRAYVPAGVGAGGAVPEPTSLLLLMLGGMVAHSAARRR